MKERVILHSDLNNFYASVECLYHPEYRGKPLAVLGDPEARHGIVLAKNYEAKAYGIQTGEAPILETGEVSRPFANCQSTTPILPSQNRRFSGFVLARSPIVKMPLRFNLA